MATRPLTGFALAWLIATTAAALVAAVGVRSEGQGAGDCIIIDDFARGNLGEFPPGWNARKSAGKEVYRIREDGGRRFLQAHARALGIQAGKPHEWNLDTHPVLTWSWRAREFPRGANEQHDKNDSPVAVYMMVDYSRIRGPKAVKYIWSEKVPAGTRLQSNNGLTQVRVLRSGADRLGQWVEERVNVRDDYLQYFAEQETPKPAGLAVLTDSDDTDSTAQGDYADFRVCRQ